MYTSYYTDATAGLSLRAKWSLYSPHLPLFGGGNDDDSYRYASCSQSSLFAVPRNPRLVYYGLLPRRRHSVFFRLEPSRTFLIPRRTVRVCEEVVGLLAERERCCHCCRCCKGEAFASEDRDFERHAKKERVLRGDAKNSSNLDESEGKRTERRRTVREVRDYEDDRDFDGRMREEEEEEDYAYEEPRVLKGSGLSLRRRVADENADGLRSSNRRMREECNEDKQRVRRDRYSSYVDEKKCAYEEPRACDGRGSSSRSMVSNRISRIEDEKVDDERSKAGGRTRMEYDQDEQRAIRDRGCSSSLVKRQIGVTKQIIRQADSRMGASNSGRHFEEERTNGRVERSSRRDVPRMVDKVEVSEQYKRHANDSRFRASDIEKANSLKSCIDIKKDDERVRLVKDREKQTTSVKNFVGLASEERTQYEQKAEANEQYETRAADYRFHVSDSERQSSHLRRIEEEMLAKDRAESSTAVNNSVQAMRDERARNEQRIVDMVEVKEQYGTYATDHRFHASDTERVNTSKTYLEIRRDDERASNSMRRSEEERVKFKGDKSTSDENIVWVTRDKRTQVNQQAIGEVQYNEQYENRTDYSRIHASNTERARNLKGSLPTKAVDQEGSSTSAVNLLDGVGYNSRVETGTTKFSKSDIEGVPNLHKASTIRTDSSSAMAESKKDSRQRSNLVRETLQSTLVQMGTNVSSDGSSSSESRVKTSAIESASKYDESSAMYMGEFVDKLRQERLALDVSEAIEEALRAAHKEATGPVLGVDEDITRQGEKCKGENGRQSSSRSGMKGPSDEMWEVRGTSSQEPPEPSKIKEEEPEKQSLAGEAVESAPSPGISDTAISRRSQRSLWTYIADIMKIGWAKSHSSAKKSGAKSSSNESLGSEAWFSGHEPEENDDETGKKETDVSPEEPMPSEKLAEQSQINLPISERATSSKTASLGEEIERSEGWKIWEGTLSSKMTIHQKSMPTINTAFPSLIETGNDQMHRSDSPKSEEEFGWQKQPEVTGTGERHGELNKRDGSPKELLLPKRPVEGPTPNPSTSIGIMRRAFSSKGVGFMSEPEDFPSCEGEKARRGILSSVLPAGITPSLIPEIESIQVASSGLPKLEEVTDGVKLQEVGETEGREGELKRRKLQRKKQVLREDFEEWEEAYEHESEQRRIDEFFMREALVEAKKAADSWEVPVGAVLVQNGKIIARGYNLVEEKRDSTAHAEMICIREASNLLQTWRLAETTLYVTLEPCPMCAGAILQARIDTVVWGAPNKLLGADGSWVRLFPTGDGGGSSLDPSQSAGPIHPFHPKITIRRGVLAIECSDAMQQFFQLRRKKNKKQEQPPPPPCLPLSTRPTKFFAKMHDIFTMVFCL